MHTTNCCIRHGRQSDQQDDKVTACSELQDITAGIMARHCPGIERGPCRRQGSRRALITPRPCTSRSKSRTRIRQRIWNEKRQALADLSANEVDAQARVEDMQARVAKLAEKAELSEKEAKRLAIYEKRLADRVAELRRRGWNRGGAGWATVLPSLLGPIGEAEEAKAQKVAARAEAVKVAVAALTEEVGAGTIRKNGEGLLMAKCRDRSFPPSRAGHPSQCGC